MTKSWIIPAVAFLIALAAGGFLFTTITTAMGAAGNTLSGGIVGFLVGGLFIFAVYVTITRYWKGSDIPT